MKGIEELKGTKCMKNLWSRVQLRSQGGRSKASEGRERGQEMEQSLILMEVMLKLRLF